MLTLYVNRYHLPLYNESSDDKQGWQNVCRNPHNQVVPGRLETVQGQMLHTTVTLQLALVHVLQDCCIAFLYSASWSSKLFII